MRCEAEVVAEEVVTEEVVAEEVAEAAAAEISEEFKVTWVYALVQSYI